MTRQEQFKAEMAAILKKYDVEIYVEETSVGVRGNVTSGIVFWSYANIDTEGVIDFNVGTRGVDHTSFE